jgi:hypothetical protein
LPPRRCTTCYHDIAAHYPGEWTKTVEDNKVFFVQASTGTRLYARPADGA